MNISNYKKIFLLFLIFTALINAQPYIYFKTEVTDTSEEEEVKFLIIHRYNLANNSVEDFPGLVGEGVTLDPSQSYMTVEVHNTGTFIYNCSDTSINYDVNDLFGAEINEILYSPQRNKLYIFSEDWGRSSPMELSVFNLATGEITSEIAITIYGEGSHLIYPERNAFFSSNGSKIYFYSTDTLTRKGQVWTYSLDDNKIVEKRDLSELGFPGADGYDLYGFKGVGLVEAYIKHSKTQVYNIYNFDSGTKSKAINFAGWAGSFFMKEGKYIIVTAEKDTPNVSCLDGSIRIYDTESSQLIRTFNFPPGGYVYTFDNYPNDIYYVKDVSLPKRQIFVIKMDLIFN